jgi:acyl transferase domain-containing protein
MKEKNIEILAKEREEVVISGMSGRFPESDSTDEFTKNLYNKVDMIPEDDRRWPTGEIHFTKFFI